jgi:hypothetical protein
MHRLLPLVVLLLAGCGAPKTYTVGGTVKRGGEKLTWPDGGTLLVIFMPEDASKSDRYSARETDTAASTYKITGIPAGRYKVAVQQFYPNEKTNFNDALGGKYDPGHTDIVIVVKGDDAALDIEIPAGGGRGKR